MAKRTALVGTNPGASAQEMCDIFDRASVPLPKKLTIGTQNMETSIQGRQLSQQNRYLDLERSEKELTRTFLLSLSTFRPSFRTAITA